MKTPREEAEGKETWGQRTVSVKRNHLFQVLKGSLDLNRFCLWTCIRLYIYDMYSSVCLLYFNKGNASKERQLSVKYVTMEERWNGVAGREKTCLEGAGKAGSISAAAKHSPGLGVCPENCNDKGGGHWMEGKRQFQKALNTCSKFILSIVKEPLLKRSKSGGNW